MRRTGAVVGCFLFAGVLFCDVSRAQTFGLVHRFHESGGPQSGLIQAADGAFYGTSRFGGEAGVGTVFRMEASGAVVTLHEFAYADGAEPLAPLIQASDGAFYGTASGGGASNLGTVFRMDADGRVTRLRSFTGVDGSSPRAALVEGSDGLFYGTTPEGGANGYGTAFRLDAAGNFTMLHSFTGVATGATPAAPLIEVGGNFYGTTTEGGANDQGVVFRMDPSGSVTLLHEFTGSDGALPYSALLLGSDGFLYGTTSIGFVPGLIYGTLFKIDLAGELTTLHVFNGTEGAAPVAALLEASDGNFYGTTSKSDVTPFGNGGIPPSARGGTAFRMDPSGGVTTLHSFDSFLPAGLTLSAGGLFYGTTPAAGYGWGGVFDMDISGAVTTLCQIRGNEGTGPLAALIQASDGNFYGTTGVGGEQRAGRSSGSTRRGVSLRSTASHRGSLRTAFNPWRASSRLQEPSMEPPLPAERTTAAPSSGSTRLGTSRHSTVFSSGRAASTGR